jgi:hypothetical protein
MFGRFAIISAGVLICMGLIKSIGNFFRPGSDNPDYTKLGRNDPCWCGSGNKYKKCHIQEDEKNQGKNYAVNCGPT